MNIEALTSSLLTPDEKQELQVSLNLLETRNHSEFFNKNQELIRSILFVESYAEFDEFLSENELDTEVFCFAFLCAKKHGVQAGGYEENLSPVLKEFFNSVPEFSAPPKIKYTEIYPELEAFLCKETIYTDCDGEDNFKGSLTNLNRILNTCGLQLAVFENSVYCACEYTILLLEKSFADTVTASWQSENFEIYFQVPAMAPQMEETSC